MSDNDHTKKESVAEATQAVKERLRRMRDDGISEVKKQLSESDTREDITRLGLCDLAKALQEGTLDPVEVLKAYQAKTLSVHEDTNCVIDLITEAEECALRLKTQAPEKRGPLYGIPVSLKDGISVKGYYDTKGMVSMAEKPAAWDSFLVQVLKSQGAVPFARTNYPHFHGSYESSNLIYGRTSNPHDPSRGAGGSSGGEGALVGGGGCPLGIGTDIGGSVRNPASWSGCCCIKPTSGRLSIRGPLPPDEDLPVPPCAGLFGMDVAGVVLGLRALLVPLLFKLDCRVPPMPFNEQVYQSTGPLTIGYYVDDGYRPVVPACARVVQEVKVALEQRGHKLVAWKPPRAEHVVPVWMSVMSADKGETIRDLMSVDAIDPCMDVAMDYILMDPKERDDLVEKMKTENPLFAEYIAHAAGLSGVADWWELTVDVKAWQEEARESWLKAGLDAVLCPSFTCPALKHGTASASFRAGQYQSYYNILDYPAGIVQVGHVTDDDIQNNAQYQTSPGDDVRDTIVEDMKDAHGLPLAVQIVAPTWQEELCLRVMREVEEVMGHHPA